MSNADDIKARLDIVDVIRDYIQLKPAGRIFKGLCPFHNEKSPSFTVTPERQIWHCFGCGKGGDVISFVMEREGLSFMETLRLLAPRAGVVLKTTATSSGQNNLKTRCLDALDEAVDYYTEKLKNSPQAEAGVKYLLGRGLTEAVVDEWSLGYSSDSWDDLLIHLKSRGYSEREIEAAGLSIKSQRGSGFYNRFRNRIMFPIRDAAGQTVGFTARVLPGSKEAETMGKYVNSPQSIVFDKSKILFGLDKAKNYIRETGFAVLVEGQMDCITAHQFNFKNTVASSGTALSEEQMAQISRFTHTIILALDADSAGQKAAERAGELLGDADLRFIESQDRWGRVRQFIDPAKSYKLNIKVALVPAGKDPDDAIRQSPEMWRKAINEAISLTEFYFTRSIASLDLSLPESKTIAVNRFLPFVKKLPSEVEKDYWLKRLAGVIHVDEKAVHAEFAKLTSQNPKTNHSTTSHQQFVQPKNQPLETRASRLSESLLSLVVRYGYYLEYLVESVMPENLAGLLNKSLYKSLIVYYNENKQNQGARLDIFALEYKKFKTWLQTTGQTAEVSHLDRLIVLADKDYFAYDKAKIDVELKNIVRELKTIYLNERREDVGRLIADYELANRSGQNNGRIVGLMQELVQLNDELKKLAK